MISTAVLVLSVLSPVAVTNLSGAWEIQSMGSDRAIAIQQKGKKLVAHRVLWPEFEGTKYKLGHLYRGRLRGRRIKGQLLVREEELPKFEVLRSFTGSLEKDGTIILDGLPLKRAAESKRLKPPPKVAPQERTNMPPGFSKTRQNRAGGKVASTDVPALRPRSTGSASRSRKAATGSAAEATVPLATASRGAVRARAAESNTSPSGVSPSEPSADTSSSLFASIMGQPGMQDLGLFQIAGDIDFKKLDAPSPLRKAEAFLAAGRHKEALKAFEKVMRERPEQRAAVQYGLGRCYLKMGNKQKAERYLARALRLDPTNRRVASDYNQARM